MTPYWIRRAQFILFLLMYVCFLWTIILPWAYPFVPTSVPKHTPNFWDDDDDYYDDDDRYGWLAHTVYRKKNSFFGTYYMANVNAFHVLAATYIAWAVLALANAVLDFVRDRGTRRARLAPFTDVQNNSSSDPSPRLYCPLRDLKGRSTEGGSGTRVWKN